MSKRYRLYPTKEQEQMMRIHCDHARFVWNLALEQNHHARQLGQYADQFAWSKDLTEARQSTWLGEGSSMIQNQAIRDLQKAFKNWWKNPGHFGAPKFRSKHKDNGGFNVADLRFIKLNRKWGSVRIPKVGYVRFKLSREVSEARSARITLNPSGEWHVSFTMPQTPVDRTPTGKSVGIDRGVTDAIYTSDKFASSPELLNPRELRTKKALQKKMAKQVKGSNRRNATKLAIAKLSAREANRRKDWVEKTSTQLIRDYDFLAIEKLETVKMTAKSKGRKDLNRMILSQGWGMFADRLKAKVGATNGVEVVEVPAAYTSQTCSNCSKVDQLSRKRKKFSCIKCGFEADADYNASCNILAAGIAVTGRGQMGNGSLSEASTMKALSKDKAEKLVSF